MDLFDDDNIRDKIHTEIILAVNDLYIHRSNVIKLRDNILAIFEKLIDSKIKEYEKLDMTEYTKEEEIGLRVCREFIINWFEQLKEELKKQ